MFVELLVSWVLVVCKVFVEMKESLERWGSKVSPVFPAASDQWVHKVPLVQSELPAQSVFVESKEKLVQSACVAHLEPQALLDPSVSVEPLEAKVSKESKVQVE